MVCLGAVSKAPTVNAPATPARTLRPAGPRTRSGNTSQICEGGFDLASVANFGPPGVGSRLLQGNFCSWRARTPIASAYNAWVDRFDAKRLLKALVAAGAKPRAPMDRAWVDKIAVRDVSLRGTELASALAYAEGQRWLADSRTRKDWIYLTRTGEIVAKESVI